MKETAAEERTNRLFLMPQDEQLQIEGPTSDTWLSESRCLTDILASMETTKLLDFS